MDSAGARSNYPPTHPGAGGKRRRASGATIKARGIPYSTNEYDLVDFFNDFHVSVLCECITDFAIFLSLTILNKRLINS